MRRGWARILRTEVAAEAWLARSLLDMSGIHAAVRNADLGTLAGLFPMGETWAEVWVPGEDEDDARRVIGRAVSKGELSLACRVDGKLSPVAGAGALTPEGAEPLPAPPAPAHPEPDVCLSCGAPWEPGFDMCWNCEMERGTGG